MSSLQKLSDLFTDLTSEVTALEKRRDSASSELTTKEARLKYLVTAITETEKQQLQAKVNQQSAISELESHIQTLKQELQGLDKSIGAIKADKQIAESDLQTIRGAITIAQERLETIEGERQQKLTEADDSLEAKQLAVAVVDSDLRKKQAKLQELETVIIDKRAEVTEKTQELEADIAIIERQRRDTVTKLDDKQGELEVMTQRVVTKQLEIEEFDQRVNDFAAYEKRATAALKAREAALLEKEAQLAATRRRPGILDNL